MCWQLIVSSAIDFSRRLDGIFDYDNNIFTLKRYWYNIIIVETFGRLGVSGRCVPEVNNVILNHMDWWIDGHSGIRKKGEREMFNTKKISLFWTSTLETLSFQSGVYKPLMNNFRIWKKETMKIRMIKNRALLNYFSVYCQIKNQKALFKVGTFYNSTT